ncbi:CD209 antigen isoform X2 [Cherax quadricarinatus]|uniref:CD209 antigen isoform X2 n=1 Tax=Cherax quadricarinatus TaxID=27406 RepID=UPI00387E7126
MRLLTVVLLLLWALLGKCSEPPSDVLSCSYQISNILREIKDVLTSTSGRCSSDGERDERLVGIERETVSQAVRQHGEVVRSLLAQTESLKKAVTSVAEVQSAHKQLLIALRTELESEKQTKRTQRRTIQDLRSEIHTLREESKNWQEHLRRMESEMKAGLQKTELAAQEATIEVKGASDRANSLGRVIRRVQRSMHSLEKIVTQHTTRLAALTARGRGRRPPPQHSLPTLPSTEMPQTGEEVDCPHPYTRIGLGCFAVHSTQRLSWEQARQHCRGIDGDLANPDDIYDVVLFLDDSFPGGWGFWIGATLDNTGTWQWVSGLPVRTQVDFWGRGEPGDAQENDEGCLFLHGWWRFRAGADPCTSEKYFICERKVN